MSQNVAIIGAGLAGLGLALALDQMGIKPTVYENRPAPLNIGGAVMLSPNALRIFDALGFYQDVKKKGYNFEHLDFQTPTGEILDIYEFGSEEKYGYKASRVYRYELIDIILSKIKTKGIQINYGQKFSNIISESDQGVTWSLTDGITITSTLLIGADGIHSTVRKHLYSSLTPRFIGIAGITASIPSTNLSSTLQTQLTSPLTILHKTHGAFVIAPQKSNASEYLIGKQKRISTSPSRTQWDAIHADKQSAITFLQENNSLFGDIAIQATKSIPNHNINIWPFYVVPKLERWTSNDRRVVLVGDAAHAIPPSAGQGISQAFEDVYMLALLLREVNHSKGVDSSDVNISMNEALEFWQEYRQDRVDKVLDLNRRVDERRLPREGDGLEQEQGPGRKMEWDLEWLYRPDLKVVVREWIRQKSSQVPK